MRRSSQKGIGDSSERDRVHDAASDGAILSAAPSVWTVEAEMLRRKKRIFSRSTTRWFLFCRMDVSIPCSGSY